LNITVMSVGWSSSLHAPLNSNRFGNYIGGCKGKRPGFFLKSLLEICLIKFVDTLQGILKQKL